MKIQNLSFSFKKKEEEKKEIFSYALYIFKDKPFLGLAQLSKIFLFNLSDHTATH
jgi:hypothetical protein